MDNPAGGNVDWRNSVTSVLRHTYLRSLAVLALAIQFSQVAEAHIRKGEASGFFSGVRHPISGLDHVLAMIAVGLWGAQLGAPAIWVLPVAFPMVGAGGMMGLLGIPLPGTEYGIAASMILLGGVVLFELKPPLWGQPCWFRFSLFSMDTLTVLSCRRAGRVVV